MGNDHCALAQKLVGYTDAFAEQSARVLAEIKNQPLEIAHLLEGILDFFFGRLVETIDVHVADAGPDFEVEIDAVAGNLVADNGELDGEMEAMR